MRAYIISLFLCLSTTFVLSESIPVLPINQTAKVVPPINTPQTDAKAQAQILDSYGKLPLSFEVNHGQTDSRVKFLSRTRGYTLFLTGDEAVFALNGKNTKPNNAKITGADHSLAAGMAGPEVGDVLRMKLRNANATAKVTGVRALPGMTNYFIGKDPKKWRTNVPRYEKVKYEGIYSGIDLVYYGNQRQLEYDFIVAPGANPGRIAFDVRGAKRIRRDNDGDLILDTGEGEIRWHKPVVYQEQDGARQLVVANYSITNQNQVGFELAQYDPGRPLYIDPVIYSTYLGARSFFSDGTDYFGEYGVGVAIDSSGSAYVTGYIVYTIFPSGYCGRPRNCPSFITPFVAKFNATGSALLYYDVFGSFDVANYGNASAIAVDGAGNAYVTGSASTGFPTTTGALQTTCTTSCAFVTEIDSTGSAFVYSTYLGGSAPNWGGLGIALDGAGNAYVTGYAGAGFPTTPGAFQTTCVNDACTFVSEINATGSALVYSTYLGEYSGQGIAVDSAGDAYVTGYAGAGFPTTPGAFQTTCDNPNSCAYVTKMNPTGSALVYSTYLGGGGQAGGKGIAVDGTGDAYVTGMAVAGFPTTPGAFQTTCDNPNSCPFVTEINPTGSGLGYSTYLGGNGSNSLYFGIAGAQVDGSGNVYVTGEAPAGFPTTPGAFQTTCDNRFSCAYLTKINSTGSALVYSTYLSGSGQAEGKGIAVDGTGNAYVVGYAGAGLRTTPGAFQKASDGREGAPDAFVVKINPLAATTITLTSSADPSAYGQVVAYTATVTSALGVPPDGETVSFMKNATVLGTASLSDGSATFMIATLSVGTLPVTAIYRGDLNFSSSTSNVVSQVVSKASTTTVLGSSLNPANAGEAVIFTASVTPEFGGTITGTVTFYDGTTKLATEAVKAGIAKFTTSNLTSGTHSITATYNGTVSFDGSSGSLTQTIN
jgi:hypothetical protein